MGAAHLHCVAQLAADLVDIRTDTVSAAAVNRYDERTADQYAVSAERQRVTLQRQIDEIVEGIREGVEAAMERQNQLLRRQNELLQALLEKESTSEISVSSISQAISRVNQRNGKTIIPIGT